MHGNIDILMEVLKDIGTGALLFGSLFAIAALVYFLPMVAFIIFVIAACWGGWE